jgi:hypothetical protein
MATPEDSAAGTSPKALPSIESLPPIALSAQSAYPAGFQPASPEVQLVRLERLYPELDSSHVHDLARELGSYREDEDVYQVVPKLDAVARLYGIDDPFGEGYGACVSQILMVHIVNGFPRPTTWAVDFDKTIRRRMSMVRRNTRLLPLTRERLERLGADTFGDYDVIPMQSGRLYPDVSVDFARVLIAAARHWELPSWVVGHHLLANPTRMGTRAGEHGEGYNILCTGDVHGTSKKGRSTAVRCAQGSVWLNTTDNDHTYDFCREAAASGTRIPE